MAQLVPAARAALPDVPPPAPLGVEAERVRVQDAIARFLLALARRQPVLLVLDDLHWSDVPSLDLLRYLGRFLGDAPLLVLGAYREAELGPGHPLVATLADLRREDGYERLLLTGLAPAETAALLRQAAGGTIQPDLARAIHAETGGNPFFVRELLRHLLEEGRLRPCDGGWTADGLAESGSLGVPEGVRQVVGRRLDRLSGAATAMLGHAAVFSGGFDFGVVRALTGLPEEEVLDALDEALAAGLIRPVDGRHERYDFVHAIVRHTLQAAWSPSRRLRLHRRGAEALERVHAGREAEHAAELAVQYHASAALPGAAKGVDYALTAAEQSRAAAARERTVAFLRMACDLAGDLDAGSRAAILRKLAVAEAEALLLDDAQRTVEQALAAVPASEAGAETVAGFLGSVAVALEDGGAATAVWQPLVERGLALLGDRRDLTWARLRLTLKPFAPIATGAIVATRWLGSDPTAVAIARASGREDDFARTLQPFDVRGPEETRALVIRARGWRQPAATIRALVMAAADWLYYHGDLGQAIATCEELLATARRHGSVSAEAEASVRLAIAHAARGEHDLACQARAATEAALDRLGPGHHLRASAAWIDALLADHLGGDWAGIAAFWTRYVADPGTAENALVVDDAALAAYAHARASNAEAARHLLAALTPTLERTDPADWLVNGAVAFGAAAVWALAEAEAEGFPEEREELAELAARYRALGRALTATGRGDYPGTSNDLAVARMAALLGDGAEAGEAFARARIAAATSGRRPLRAIVDLDEALALIRRPVTASPVGRDPDRGGALLDAAAAEFGALGMAEWEGRALALRARAAQSASPGVRPVLPAGLTERELDVLRLVAEGCSDREISGRLYLSPRTVNAHLRNMFRKTEVTNRTELSVWAVARGLLAR